MHYIYKWKSPSGKIYIGQTNNLAKRKNGHNSSSFNPKNSEYNLPFHAAIRKYGGLDNFELEVLEEIDDSQSQSFINERETYYITLYQSTIEKNGYNYCPTGFSTQGITKTFSECCNSSKVFNEEQIRDIQDMLLKGYANFEIKTKYPQLSESFLQNINSGLNFRREDLSYPLKGRKNKLQKFTLSQKYEIIEKLKQGLSYKKIMEQYPISSSFLSGVNYGKHWFNEKETYPLNKKDKRTKK